MVNSVENDIRFASLNYGKLGLQEESYDNNQSKLCNNFTTLDQLYNEAPDKLSSQASESDLESSSIHFLCVHITTCVALTCSLISNPLFATPCSETNKLPCDHIILLPCLIPVHRFRKPCNHIILLFCLLVCAEYVRNPCNYTRNILQAC